MSLGFSRRGASGREGRTAYPKRWGPKAAALAAAVVLGLASGCATNPITGSSSFNLFSESEDVAMGEEAYAQVKQGEKLITSGADYEMVQRAMNRLASVSGIQDFPYEAVLIDDPATVNAFCLPGGKMAVYTGILPVCQSEAGLATVMGHEIGHAIGRHGTSRLTLQIPSSVIQEYLGAKDYAPLGEALLNLGTLKYGRDHELDADHAGLLLMARAGYDPSEAVRFWQRMAELTGDQGFEFLSTHPSNETRISRLQEKMPEALAIYEAGGG